MHSEAFKISHLKEIRTGVNSEMFDKISAVIRTGEVTGKLMAFTLISDGKPVAVGGIYEIWEKVGEAFALISAEAVKYPKSLFKFFSINMEIGIEAGEYNRVQAAVKSDFEKGIRFVERLKFNQEGLMKYWGPDGSDYFMYARVI